MQDNNARARVYKLKHIDPSCRCHSLARLFLDEVQPKSLLAPGIVNTVCAMEWAVAETQLRSIATEIKIAGIFHLRWCMTPETLQSPPLVDQVRLFSQLTQLLQVEQDRLQKIALQHKTDKQDNALLQMSAIYLKQSLWVIRCNWTSRWSNTSTLGEITEPGADELHQLVYGNRPRTSRDQSTLDGVSPFPSSPDEVIEYPITRFQVSALSRYGNRFLMYNTVDAQFADKIPECDREVRSYELNARRGKWEHTGRHSIYCLTREYELPRYSTYTQYNLIMQTGFQIQPYLEQCESIANILLPELLFEIICYASDSLASTHVDCDGWHAVRRFSPDLVIPNFIQFQRYLSLRCSTSTLLDVTSRRNNVKRAFQRIDRSIVQFNTPNDYNAACWSHLWILVPKNNIQDIYGDYYNYYRWGQTPLLKLHRMSTLSHLKLAFETDCASAVSIHLTQLLETASAVLHFLTRVLPSYSEIQQAEDGVWYIFPLSNSLNKEQDLKEISARIDQFLLNTYWQYKENPTEAEAIKLMEIKNKRKQEQQQDNNNDNISKSKSKRARIAK